MRLSVGIRTDVGRVRDINEDAYLIKDPLYVVADGMGGHVAGDVAARTAVTVIADQASSASADDPQTLARLLHDANRAILERTRSDPTLQGMGTTCTLALADEAAFHIAHVGDSRAYRLRNGRLEQLTDDHTLVGRMVREGKMSAEEAERHPQRSIITRALGSQPEVEVDVFEVEAHAEDCLLLCSDGLSSMLDGESIRRVLADERDPQRAADRLVDLAIEAGGEDNITAIVLSVDGTEAPHAQTVGRSEASDGSAPVVPTSDAVSSPGEEVSDTRGAVLTEQRASARVDTDPIGSPAGEEGRPPSRWGRRLLGLVVLLLVVAGAVVAARWSISNSWYVGVDPSDSVTIYRGIPEEIAGLDLKSVEQTTNLQLSDLPENRWSEVKQGIKVDSLADAQDRVSSLRSLALRLERERRPDRRKTTKG